MVGTLSRHCISRGPGTDLTIGLADGHLNGRVGASTAKNGITCNPNIPTEEVFTTPHARRVSKARVASTKPLSLPGHADRRTSRCASRHGRIVEAQASPGRGACSGKVLDTDEGASPAGRGGAGAALLADLAQRASCSSTRCSTRTPPATSRWASAIRQVLRQRRRSFRRTRFRGTRRQSSSLIHIDWMIGSDEIDIDGVHADGRREPVFRKGEWA
jgi:aminopeptidase